MVGHDGSSAGSYLADPTSPIPFHCASIVATSTLRVKWIPLWITGHFFCYTNGKYYTLNLTLMICFVWIYTSFQQFQNVIGLFPILGHFHDSLWLTGVGHLDCLDIKPETYKKIHSQTTEKFCLK